MKTKIARSRNLLAAFAVLVVFGSAAGCSRSEDPARETRGGEAREGESQLAEVPPTLEEGPEPIEPIEIKTGDPEQLEDFPPVAGPPSEEPEAEIPDGGDVDEIDAKARELDLRERELAVRERELELRKAEEKRAAEKRAAERREAERLEAERREAERLAEAEPVDEPGESMQADQDGEEESQVAEIEPPAEPPPPQRVRVDVPAGTELEIRFLTAVASDTSQEGDLFRAKVFETVTEDGLAAIPAGSEVHGRVTEAFEPKKVGGRSRLGIEFTDLVLPSGRTIPLQASFVEEGDSSAKKDAKTIGGGAAAGAILGRILGGGSKSKRSLIGAIVGAAAGTAIASRNAGEPVVIDGGTEIRIRLDESVEVEVQR